MKNIALVLGIISYFLAQSFYVFFDKPIGNDAVINIVFLFSLAIYDKIK